MEAQETAELIEQSGHGDKSQNRSALTISILAMVLAIASLGGSNAMKEATQENILAANAYAFYQAKSLKQTLAENEAHAAGFRGDKARAAEMLEKADRYENEPKEGKKDLLVKAKALEAERDDAKQRSPWIGYANTAYQLAIVLLSASILAVSMSLFWGSFIVAGFGVLLSSQGLLLWI